MENEFGSTMKCTSVALFLVSCFAIVLTGCFLMLWRF